MNSLGKIRAAFYPKFDNERPRQEIRARMIELVSQGMATLEVSLKHNGSLFMYAGPEGGAYSKNSLGNIYTATGIFVLGRTFHEAWGEQASKKQSKFNDFLEMNQICVSMELVTTVLGEEDNHPLKDYVVVLGISQLNSGKPKFYSTPEIIEFCGKWRLPTNSIWLFSTRESAMTFFATYDALFEEGTTAPVCKALDEIADVSVPGSIDYAKFFKGEILEGLVARIISSDSAKCIESVLNKYPPVIFNPVADGLGHLGPGLNKFFSVNYGQDRIKALLESKCCVPFSPKHSDWFGGDRQKTLDKTTAVANFLKSRPTNSTTAKLQEMFRLLPAKDFDVKYASTEDFDFKIVVHVRDDKTFHKYQKAIRNKPGSWPSYRGFFVEVKLSNANNKKTTLEEFSSVETSTVTESGLSRNDAKLMLKLKLLPYNIRNFLIINGIQFVLRGLEPYKKYYNTHLGKWNVSESKKLELTQKLDELGNYFRQKYKGQKKIAATTFLSEAEPFLKRIEKPLTGTPQIPVINEVVINEETGEENGHIIFFAGIPGSDKYVLCEEIVKFAGEGKLGDDCPVNHLKDDKKAKYWPKLADELHTRPNSILIADKNAPNVQVWDQIKGICGTNKVRGIPVVPDSEGTETNPFSLDALAVFIFRVIQRNDGNLGRSSPNVGYVLLMIYHLFDGKNRKEFENELIQRFGCIVKVPLLVEISNRPPLPQGVMSFLKKGIELYKLHSRIHANLDSSQGNYAKKWAHWEKKMSKKLADNAQYLNSIQVPFESSSAMVLEQLREMITKGANTAVPQPSTEKRRESNPLPNSHQKKKAKLVISKY